MSNTASRTVTISATRTITESSSQPTPETVPEENLLPEEAIIRLQTKKKNKKVAWRQDTIDNEGMGKKSSKCCCIYRKPHDFGESSSDSEDEDCDHCRGHVEKKSNPKDN